MFELYLACGVLAVVFTAAFLVYEFVTERREKARSAASNPQQGEQE